MRSIFLYISGVFAGSALSLTLVPAVAESTEAPVPAVPQVALETAWIVYDEVAGIERLVSAGHRSAPGTTMPAGAQAQLHTARFRYEASEPAAALRIDLVVPQGGRYLAGSATGPGAVISVSADGGQTFFPTAELRPDDTVSVLRFELAGPVVPGTAGLVSFRTVGVEEHAEAKP